ncbi:DUF874 family protein [Helicobacter pylori]|nr:hypothetical protein CEP78_005575 [Helicobacter pylori]WQR87811.1 DUF874 family protein [Helicobacter pylori]
MPVIRVLVMLATMMMKLVKTAKEKKVFKNVGMSIMGIAFWEAIKDSIKKQIKKSNWICGNVKTADDYLKTHPNSWFNSAIGVTTITAMLMNVCFADDQSKKEVAETQKEAENARDRANKSGIELEQEQQKTEQEKQKTEQEKQKTEQEKQKTSNIETNNQIKVEQKQQKTEQEKQKTEQEKQKTEQEKQKTEQEKQKTSNIETNNQIKVEQEQQKTEQEKQKTEQEKQKTEQEKQKTSNIETNNQIKVEQEQQKTEQEKQKTNNTQKDLVKYAEQNCQENHNQFFIKKLGIKGGIAIEVEAECKTPKPAKTNQTPIQPKHLPNSKQPHSQRGSKAQEFIAYLQKELEFLPYSQKAIAKQVNFYKPSSIAYLELDPRDFKVTEEWQKENLKIRSKAQAKMLEMRDLKPDPQAHLPTSQSLLFVQKIFADVNKEIEAVANTEKKAEKAGYGYSKRM